MDTIKDAMKLFTNQKKISAILEIASIKAYVSDHDFIKIIKAFQSSDINKINEINVSNMDFWVVIENTIRKYFLDDNKEFKTFADVCFNSHLEQLKDKIPERDIYSKYQYDIHSKQLFDAIKLYLLVNEEKQTTLQETVENIYIAHGKGNSKDSIYANIYKLVEEKYITIIKHINGKFYTINK